LLEETETCCYAWALIPNHSLYIAVRELGYRGNEVGEELHLGGGGVSVALGRGASILRERPELQEEILQNLVK